MTVNSREVCRINLIHCFNLNLLFLSCRSDGALLILFRSFRSITLSCSGLFHGRLILFHLIDTGFVICCGGGRRVIASGDEDLERRVAVVARLIGRRKK